MGLHWHGIREEQLHKERTASKRNGFKVARLHNGFTLARLHERLKKKRNGSKLEQLQSGSASQITLAWLQIDTASKKEMGSNWNGFKVARLHSSHWHGFCKGTFQSPFLATFALPQVLLTELTCSSPSNVFHSSSAPLPKIFPQPAVLTNLYNKDKQPSSSSDNFRRFSGSGSSSKVFLFYFIFYFLMAPLLLFFPLRHISFIFPIISFRYI